MLKEILVMRLFGEIHGQRADVAEILEVCDSLIEEKQLDEGRQGRWALNNSELVSSLGDTVSDYFYFSLWLACIF